MAIMEIIEKCSTGKCLHAIFNYCNDGAISWYDFTVAIKALTGSTCIINPIPTSDYPTDAKRPHYSALDTTRFRETFHKDIPGWRESLEKCLVRLNQ
jgi:dTDP-4-dehydrorhamnose reductase